MRKEILELLMQTDGYISGEKLSRHLGVTRAAIWKNINQLKEQGYEIESITRKGYRLISSPDIFTEQELQYGLHTKALGKKIFCRDVVDSTNQLGKQEALKGAPHGTILLAEQQLKGKGRRGRSWVSPSKTGIWMSCILRPKLLPQQAPMLTLVTGLSVCKALRQTTGLEAYIKWPNDIVLNGKKICGILTEMNAEMEQVHYVVLGMGLNVNQETFPDEIRSLATSLKIEGGETYNRKKIIQKILTALEADYESFMETKDLSLLLSEYKRYCITLGKKVKVIQGEEVIYGKAVDLTARGELVIQKDDGSYIAVFAGEVSVRGLYGYI